MGEGGGRAVGGAGVDGQTAHSRSACGMCGGCPGGVVVFVDEDSDGWEATDGHYTPPILL
ncbi:hypothetical protein GCM10010405_61430 [Streptomyces macrosporus]|uniref:Uncharacterized protein n=1 Tax=Streptomyces macrosporus TaxID=44032 RepID=A0ABN3KSH4_9ACTN